DAVIARKPACEGRALASPVSLSRRRDLRRRRTLGAVATGCWRRRICLIRDGFLFPFLDVEICRLGLTRLLRPPRACTPARIRLQVIRNTLAFRSQDGTHAADRNGLPLLDDLLQQDAVIVDLEIHRRLIGLDLSDDVS